MNLPLSLQMGTETYNTLAVLLGLVQIITILFAGWSIGQQKKQIKNLSQQVKLQTEEVRIAGQSVFVDSFSHFSSVYFQIMSALPAESASEMDRNLWWYRYLELLIAEVNFSMRGLIDPTIFEIWMHELARHYFQSPHGAAHMGTFAGNSKKHLDRVLAEHSDIHVFFDALEAAAKEKDGVARAQAIQVLVARTYNTNRGDAL
jgi:hypothetical protein